MSNKIERQKRLLRYALACLNTIEVTNESIRACKDVDYAKTVLQESIEGYATAISEIVKDVLISNNILIPQA